MILIYLLLINSQEEFVFYDSEGVYFALAMLCVVLMTLVEVGIVLLKSTLCIDLGNGGREAVLEGNTYDSQIEKNLVDEAKALSPKEKKKKLR